MGKKRNKQVVRDYIEKIVNTGDISLIGNYLSPDYTEVHNKRREKISMEEAGRRILGIRNTYPDFKISVDRQIAEGDWVVSCCTFTGTHLGVWLNIQPTGKKVQYTGVIVDKIVNGKYTEHGGAVNLFDAFYDLGLIRQSS